MTLWIHVKGSFFFFFAGEGGGTIYIYVYIWAFLGYWKRYWKLLFGV